MKKINFLLVLCMVFSLVGCKSSSSNVSETNTTIEQATATLQETMTSTTDKAQNNQNGGNRQGGGMNIDKSSDTELQELIKTVVPKFKQYTYNDEDTGTKIEYNLYVPENYDKSKSYPLVQFIPDSSLVNKGVLASLTQGYGALVWATPEFQKAHECIVYVPTFNITTTSQGTDNPQMASIVNDNFEASKDIDVNIRCLKKIMDEYSIDKKRVYITGQSMGGMMSFYYAINYSDIFAAYMPVGSQWDTDKVSKLTDRKFIYLVSEGDTKASVGMNELKEKLDQNGTKYGYAYFSIKDSMENQDKIVNDTVAEGNNFNLFMFKKGEVVPAGIEANNEHMWSFDYAYKIDAAREWLFSQSK